MTETFYEVLGVSEDATTEEIQSAYRERLKEVHPDVSDDEDASEATQRLIEARDVLVDEDERAQYDRLGHESYVGGGDVSAAAESVSDDDSTDVTTDSTDTSRSGPRDRARRERTASQRVRQERAEYDRGDTDVNQATTDTASAGATDRGYGPNGATVTDQAEYSVRTEVDTQRSFGPIWPTGRRLTLLGIFFALYPLLLFSALLPAFPLFVNIVVGACTLMLIGYLQSMPRIAIIVFGGWSAISVTFLLLLGIEFLSLLGLAVLSGTVLPFGFSLLTAWALRY